MTKEEFDKKFIENQERLKREAFFISHDEDTAEDLVQSSYCTGLKNIHIYQEKGRFLPWLVKIMKNIHFTKINVSRRKKTIIEIPIIIGKHTMQFADYRYLPENNFLLRNRQERLKWALNNIPYKYKKTINWVVEERLSYRQIALREKIKDGTVKSRIFRAKRILQKSMDKFSEKMVSYQDESRNEDKMKK